MTLPFERLTALKNAKEFLRNLLDPKKTPKVPRDIRRQAYYVLKHYPDDHLLNELAEKCPEILKGEPYGQNNS